MIEILAFDWDEVMMICMGFAGLAYIIADLKREKRLEHLAIDHSERLAKLESIYAWSDNQRIMSDLLELTAKVGAIEARLDYQPVRHTKRSKDGKFIKRED